MEKKVDIYQVVTDRILAELEEGRIPWKKPWGGTSTGAVRHTSRTPYSLANQFLLVAQSRGRQEGYEYLTIKQCNEEGGTVKKGEKSSIVIFWNMYTFKEKDEQGEEHERTVPLLRYYHVFEVGQCDGIRRKYNPEKPRHVDTIEEAEQVVDAYFAREACSLQNTIARNSAGYDPQLDVVVVPTIDQHVTAEDYYSTLFHEMTHSTGHPSRLNRPEISNFDITPYSREELVAEMGASFLSNILGIDTEKTHRNSVGYIQGWMGKLSEDKRAFITAAGRAEAAVKYILHGKQTRLNGQE